MIQSKNGYSRFLNRMVQKLAAAGGAVCALASANALSLELVVDQAEIQEGDTFSVGLFADFEASKELVLFAFDLNAVGSLLPGGLAAFQSWSVAAPLLEGFTFSPTEVAGEGDLFNPFVGGGSQRIATMNFQALGSGTDSVSISGYTSDFMGITLIDTNTFQLEESDIDLSLDIQISPVPDSMSWAMFPAILGGFALLRRRFRQSRFA